MNSQQIRKQFLQFFKEKGHTIVPSSSIVVKNDPTLLFTNAGMNQFKDIFLGNTGKPYLRAADTQKCLRVSGKHNDLEEVGKDTYHHTMFEMLGNWSFGDYFKREAIEYAWKLLTEVFGIDKSIIYVTVFGGDEKDGLLQDTEAFDYWKQWIAEDRILLGSKKDNFWEMGETGPCGGCSEIHVDLRDEADKQRESGRELVNKDNPLVIEVWNLVFMEFNRMADGSLVPLKEKNVDTGMGFERLCMVLQGKKSNYDTDVFQPLIQHMAQRSGIAYGADLKTDIAMRVCADHIRAVAFAIADGQLPANAKAGYVIRRILRRAIRYGYTFLNFTEPFMFALVDVLVGQMGEQFPELVKNKTLIEKVIKEEELSFLRTLANGIAKFDRYIAENKTQIIDGDFAFELFDTYGFPVDLTELMAKEHNRTVDMAIFDKNLAEQKERSRNAAKQSTDDWIELTDKPISTEFVGYDTTETTVKILKYRKVTAKNSETYQLVFDRTPFYAEMGGQIGDSGCLVCGKEKIEITDTQKENNLILHITNKLPSDMTSDFTARVNRSRRCSVEAYHSATHLLHYALRQVLGSHVEQKGSYVSDNRLRFDFSHHSKMTDEEVKKVEKIVNKLGRDDLQEEELRDIPIEEARKIGAMALFGEKYGERVRVVRFGNSVELCGGTHTQSTGRIGMVKIVSESAVAAGVRRIEALCGEDSEDFVYDLQNSKKQIIEYTKATQKIEIAVKKIVEDNTNFKQQIEELKNENIEYEYQERLKAVNQYKDINFIEIVAEEFEPDKLLRLARRFRKDDNCVFIAATHFKGRATIEVAISDDLVSKGCSAQKAGGQGIKYINAQRIGGEPRHARAFGDNIEGLAQAAEEIRRQVITDLPNTPL
ncbi:MAG: alanine--tRNA ligase [Bacteroidales bacterium]|jgi:alanyl-tRNA synthetase|nr:alanine--tRNA ligase [Bacteroidales bacterium]